jgi:hypothetical protein
MGKSVKEKPKIKDKFHSDHYSFEEEILKDEFYENDLDEKFKKEISNLYMAETSMIIRDKILQYTDTNFYPLCEYLNIDNVENYINWLLS